MTPARRFWLAVSGGVGAWAGVGIMLVAHREMGFLLAGVSALLAGSAALAGVYAE
jgi:hypothetical protein